MQRRPELTLHLLHSINIHLRYFAEIVKIATETTHKCQTSGQAPETPI